MGSEFRMSNAAWGWLPQNITRILYTCLAFSLPWLWAQRVPCMSCYPFITDSILCRLWVANLLLEPDAGASYSSWTYKLGIQVCIIAVLWRLCLEDPQIFMQGMWRVPINMHIVSPTQSCDQHLLQSLNCCLRIAFQWLTWPRILP